VKRGFTLIEVLIVLVIMAVLVGTAVLSVVAGMKSANLRNASRAVVQCVRHARAVALLKNRPVVVTFEEVNAEGSFAKSRISMNFSEGAAGKSKLVESGTAQTIWGETVEIAAGEPEQDALAFDPQEFEGVHVRVDDKDATEERVRISVFSNADYLKRQAAQARADAINRRELANMNAGREETKTEEKKETSGDTVAATPDVETSTDIVYETNGRCRPYRVDVWKDGQEPESGIRITVDRFGKIIVGNDDR